MDWGVTFIFILSIVGAIAIAQGDIFMGVFAFLIIYGILAVIRWIIHTVKQNNDNNETETKANNCNTYNNAQIKIVFSEEHFENFLDMIIKFLKAYSSVVSDEWWHLFISQEIKKETYSDTYYCYDGFLEFQIILGSWWENIMREYPDIDDYMKSLFCFDAQERKFTHTTFKTGSSTCCAFPREKVNTILQKYLDNYEAKHPEVRFERASWGAKLTKI